MSSVGEARHLQAPVSDMNRLVKHYVHSFYQALGVPPQKLGAPTLTGNPIAPLADCVARRKRQL